MRLRVRDAVPMAGGSGSATRVAAWWSARGSEDQAQGHGAAERVDLRTPALHARVNPADGGRIEVDFVGPAAREDAGKEEPGPAMDAIFVRPGGVELSIAERGGPTDYRVLSVQTRPDFAFADLENDASERGSSPARKRIIAPLLFDVLIVCVEDGAGLTLGESTRASEGVAAVRQTATWVARAGGERTAWARAPGGVARLLTAQTHFHLVAGCGSADPDRVERLLAWANHALHEEADPIGSEPRIAALPRTYHGLGSAISTRSRGLPTDDRVWGSIEPDRGSVRRPIERFSAPPA